MLGAGFDVDEESEKSVGQQLKEAMKANAVIGVDIDYEVFGEGGMMMVSLSGTAVLLSGEIPQEKLPTTTQ